MRLSPRFVSALLAPILVATQLPAQTSAVSEAPSAQDLQLRVTEAASSARAPKGLVLSVTAANGSPVADAAVVVRLPDTEPTGTFRDGTHAMVLYTDQSGHVNVTGIQWSPGTGVVAIRATATKGTSHAGILIQEELTPASSKLAPAQLAPAPGTLPDAVVPLPKPPPLTAADAGAIARPLQSQAEPSVSVTSAAPGESRHSSKTKWIILAAIAAAAGGAGVAMMGKKSGSSAVAAPGLSIGAGTVSVGQPPH